MINFIKINSKGVIVNFEEKRPDIEYPCSWEYKVIGSDIDNVLSAIEDAASGLDYSVSPSNVSRNNKYFSVNMKIEVPNETTRDVIYSSLTKCKDVKLVL
jgi:putative lipoic acid-binding regulatory protein